MVRSRVDDDYEGRFKRAHRLKVSARQTHAARHGTAPGRATPRDDDDDDDNDTSGNNNNSNVQSTPLLLAILIRSDFQKHFYFFFMIFLHLISWLDISLPMCFSVLASSVNCDEEGKKGSIFCSAPSRSVGQHQLLAFCLLLLDSSHCRCCQLLASTTNNLRPLVPTVYAGSKCHSFILPFIHFVSVVTLLLAFYFAAQLYSFVWRRQQQQQQQTTAGTCSYSLNRIGNRRFSSMDVLHHSVRLGRRKIKTRDTGIWSRVSPWYRCSQNVDSLFFFKENERQNEKENEKKQWKKTV